MQEEAKEIKTMASPKVRKHVSLTLRQRLIALERMDEGVPLNIIAEEFKVSPWTLRRIRKKGAQVRHQAEAMPKALGRRRSRKPAWEELDTRLYTWFLERRAIGDVVTDTLLREKAFQLNQEYGGPSSFTASKAWIWRFKKRHHIYLVNIHREAVRADQEIVEEFVTKFVKRIENEEILLENIYNMNETSLLWKTLPQRMLTSSSEEKSCGRKVKEDRVTVALCANATGTHKLTPLFIHRFEKPKALKHCKDRLPVIYCAEKDAYMTRSIFVDWLKNHFKPAVKKHQLEIGGLPERVLLLLDNCLAHTLPPDAAATDDNFEIVYFPTNSTSFLQPMNQGVISKTKTCFRKQILRKILTYPLGIQEFCKDYDVKDCMDLVNDSWAEVTSTDICNSWRKLLRHKGTNEEPVENGSFSDEQEDMKRSIMSITGGNVSMEEINEWLSTCEVEEAKTNCLEKKQNAIRNDDNVSSKQRQHLLWTEEDAENLFNNLKIMVSQKPHLRLYADALCSAYHSMPMKQEEDEEEKEALDSS